MAFSRPTLQEIVDRIAADFAAKITGATTLALRSVLLIMARAYAGAVHLVYGYLDNMSKELFARTATGDSIGGKLDTIGSEYGIFRKAATAATGTVTCTGTATTVIPAGSALTSSTSNRYTTDALATIGIGGTVNVAITCDTTGTAGNDDAGISLSFESPIVGVDSTAIVGVGGLTGGADVESDEDYRLRILARKRLASHGGAKHDLENWMLEVAGVTRSWAYPEYMGAGTVACYFVLDDQTPITPTAAQVTAMLAYLTEHAGADGQTHGVPVTMLPGLFVASPVIRTLDFSIQIMPSTDAIKTAIIAELTDYLLREGTPNGGLYLSKINEAIASVQGLTAHRLIVPAVDPVVQYNQVTQLGTVSWGDYGA